MTNICVPVSFPIVFEPQARFIKYHLADDPEHFMLNNPRKWSQLSNNLWFAIRNIITAAFIKRKNVFNFIIDRILHFSFSQLFLPPAAYRRWIKIIFFQLSAPLIKQTFPFNYKSVKQYFLYLKYQSLENEDGSANITSSKRSYLWSNHNNRNYKRHWKSPSLLLSTLTRQRLCSDNLFLWLSSTTLLHHYIFLLIDDS